jgi:hypothetical protein
MPSVGVHEPMARWFFHLIYGGVTARFESRYSVRESVSRLAHAVKPSIFMALSEQSAVGTVTEDKVSIQRVIPFIRNAWKPFFIGSFQTAGDRVVLAGQFTCSPLVKIFMSIWFGFLVLWTVIATAAVIGRPPADFWFPLFGIAMFAFGIALVRVGKWLARNDIAWLSRVISNALESSDGQLPAQRVHR